MFINKNNKHIRKLIESQFIRNVCLVALGTVGAQVITMVSSPIIARIYGPEIFGQLGVFIAILSMIAPVAALTYPTAIVLPEQDLEAITIAKLSIYLSFTVAFFTLILFLVYGREILNYFKLDVVNIYFLLIPVAVFFSGTHQVLEQWIIRVGNFRANAKITVVHSCAINLSKVSAGYFLPSAIVLIFFQALSSLLFSVLLLIGVKGSLKVELKNTYSLKDVAIKYKDFAVFRAPQEMINAISQSLPVLMLATFYGASAAGFYTIGRTVLSAPASLLGKAVGDVFYPRISAACNNKENLYPLVGKATFLLFIVGIVPFGIVIILGPLLFSIVFGDEWYKAGEYAQWIALWVFFMFINNPSIKVIPVINKQGLHLIFTILTIVIRFLALFIGYYYYNSDLISIILFSLSGALANCFLIAGVLYLCNNFDKQRFRYD